jgi:hypothetical protein
MKKKTGEAKSLCAIDRAQLRRVRLFAKQFAEEVRILDRHALGEASADTGELLRAAKRTARQVERIEEAWVE